MKTYTTSEAIAILEQGQIATFESTGVECDLRLRLRRAGRNVKAEYYHDEDWWSDFEIELRSDWVRTDKEDT